jgi:hypothetical protein
MTTNYDEKTGIHYGVISPNSISAETLNDLIDRSVDTIYESAKDDLLRDFTSFCDDHNIDVSCIDTDQIVDGFNQKYENDYHGYEYEDKEYSLHICDDNFGIFVIRSPYYTYTKQCSPCAPNAGDLNSPISLSEYEKGDHNAFMYGTVKAYCLPKDFFDDEYAKIPYRYYRVSDDKEMIEEIIEA